MAILFANNAVATTAISIGAIDTIIELTSGHGVGFPVVGSGDWFYITLVDPVTADVEVCKVTQRDGDSLTVVRGVDNTVARAWPAGSIIEMRPNAQVFRDIVTELERFGDYLPLSGGELTGPLRFRTSGPGQGFDVYGSPDGSLIANSDDPNNWMFLFPSARNGNGGVVAYRFRYAMPVRTITSTTFTAVSGLSGVASTLLVYDNGAAGTITLSGGSGPSGWQQGDFFSVMQRGAGAVTISPAYGITLRVPTPLTPTTRAQYSVITATALTPSEWVISGDLAEAT